ncbi:ammonium transporter [Paenibacillus albus]|uniref:Ammonium transporter n=1 Tax=Paenibacillus albus TaxID=2495582 RepID=A0A3Q8XA67_9BACL|nr:ammonium transporter [Paenibacillus albus]AZN43853.1 ammonium transporter [Paenibacillus albus]
MTSVFAEEAAAPAVDTGDSAWMLISSAIVMFMFVPGLALFYGGMVSSRNVLSTMMYSLSSMLVVSLVWVLCAYTLAFGPDAGGLIGKLDFAMFNGVNGDPSGTMTIPHFIFAIFQCLFAAITVALISGAAAERIRLSAWVIFSVLWVIFVYAPMAHWTWGGGWLMKLGGLDFAGGTVVHILSGVSALVVALMIGPRQGFPHQKESMHNVILFFIGGMSLWFGWMGFNGGSALASGSLATLAYATTHMAASAGGIAWMAIEWYKRGKPTLVGTVTGVIAGLIAITPAAGFVSVASSIPIGAFASVVCYFGVHFVKSRFNYDDTLDVFGLHGLGGIWGAIATGIFASKSVNPAGNDGLLFGNPKQVLIQLLDVGVAIVLAAVGTYVLLKVVSLFVPLRVAADQEEVGLDISLHGENAYKTPSPAPAIAVSNRQPSHALVGD